jgi:hypothetical protein
MKPTPEPKAAPDRPTRSSSLLRQIVLQVEVASASGGVSLKQLTLLLRAGAPVSARARGTRLPHNLVRHRRVRSVTGRAQILLLTSYFVVEQPGIEPAMEMALTCGNAELDDVKVRETTRKYLRIRDGC